MSDAGTWRILTASMLRDIGCALRTPAIVLTALLGMALCLVMAEWIGADSPDEELRRFLLSLAAIVPPLMGGSSVALFLLAEEREHGAVATLVRAGASPIVLAASKTTAALLFTALMALVCLVAVGFPSHRLPAAAGAVALASVPLLIGATASAMLVRTYAQTSWSSLLLVCLALPSPLAAIDTSLCPLAAFMPLEAGSTVAIRLGGFPNYGSDLCFIAFIAWLAISLAAMTLAVRRMRLEGAGDSDADSRS